MSQRQGTQRDSDFRDTEDSCVLAREWLTSKDHQENFTVKQFDSELKKGGKHKIGLHGTEPLPDSCRSIANFLSKQGKTISHETIMHYLIKSWASLAGI